MDSHITGPGVQDLVGTTSTLSTELLTDHHHDSIIKLSVHCCVWKTLNGGLCIPVRRSTSMYTVAGWGIMSCVCGTAFLCGSTLVKVQLHRRHMTSDVKSDVKPNKQTY